MLLAKSPKIGRPDKGLAEHCNEVMQAFEALFGTIDGPTRLGREWLHFFRLSEADFVTFYVNGLVACGLHDLGKANSGFQDAVTSKGHQQIRHEHLSGLILALPEFRAWLEACPDADSDLVLSAVIGHHLKATSDSDQASRLPQFGGPLDADIDVFRVFGDHADVRTIFAQIADRLNTPSCQAIPPTLWSFSGIGYDFADHRAALIRRFNKLQRELRRDLPRRQRFLAVKTAVIAADAAGSGLVREQESIIDWIAKAFSVDNVLDGDTIEREVLQPRVAEVEARKRQTDPDFRFRYRDFQEAAEALPERSLLLAGCGGGKTLAAWRWIKGRLDQQPASRVLFLYPTRGTATEGFRDYVSHAPETRASLLTGTARFELQDMFGNPDDVRYGQGYETNDRLYALGYWHKQIFSATVDQFLGFMQQIYRSVCLLPVLADSIVVFDEVHSFDTALFAMLKKFLEAFNVPVLCMTASLPEGRRRELQALGLTVFPNDAQRFDDLEAAATLPRYRVTHLTGPTEAEAIAIAARNAGRRVLWVVNTVDRCQQLARQLNALCYHSRFTLADRKERHRDVVSAFQVSQATSQGIIAITTQVCEMSLDLDAHVLISETAPISSLIQRFGRCNRHAATADAPQGEIYLYSPDKPAPYTKADLLGLDEFVTALDGQSVSQARLDELLAALTSSQIGEGTRLSTFLDDGPWAAGGQEELRDGNDHTVSAILDSDVPTYLALRKKGAPIDGLILPAPKHPKELARQDGRLGRFLWVVPASQYDRRFGLFKHPTA